MRPIIRNTTLIAVVLLLCGLFVWPPSQSLKLGKDLAGGISLVYEVDVDPSVADEQQAISQMIAVLKDRVDPEGVRDIQIVQQGRDRIEVTMPLPGREAQEYRQRYQDALAAVGDEPIDPATLARTLTLPDTEREAALRDLAAGSEDRYERFAEAARLYDEASAARQAAVNARESGAPQETVEALEIAWADAEAEFEAARAVALRVSITPDDLRSALTLPDDSRRVRNRVEAIRAGEETMVEQPSRRERALSTLKEQNPDQVDAIDAAVVAFGEYQENQSGFDDPEELKRLLQATGVIAFRIAVAPQGGQAPDNVHPDEADLREQLVTEGPRRANAPDARWFRINKVENYYDSLDQRDLLEANPSGYFSARYGYVVERFRNDYFMLLWDTPALRLTKAEGEWGVESAGPTTDPETQKPAIRFSMDARGAARLGRLTQANLGKPMAIVLDDEVYTAPTLQGAISTNGIITGDFTPDEIAYVSRVLQAGAVAGSLSPEPLSENNIAPSLGQENLNAGLMAGIYALIAVSVFMVLYYFGFGIIAVFSLSCNAVFILGIMAAAGTAFTLPGIAGVILTFGMAVDSNVLIYERIREELRLGNDLRTSVRLGFQKALSSIVDGNITNLIVCLVLGFFGTQEIKGFAITLGIGVVGTLFASLGVSRIVLAWLVDEARVKRMRMLPMAVPAIERTLEPRIDWMRFRWIFVLVSAGYISLGLGMVFTQGKEMLDIDFRGGTVITVEFRNATEAELADPGVAVEMLRDGDSGTPRVILSRQDVVERVQAIGDAAGEELNAESSTRDPEELSQLTELSTAIVQPINPGEDRISSAVFQIRTLAQDVNGSVREAIVAALAEYVENKPPVAFSEDGIQQAVNGPVYPVLTNRLGESIGRPEIRFDTTDWRGGVAIVLENLRIDDPSAAADSVARPTLEGLNARLEQMRNQPSFQGAAGRDTQLVVIGGTDNAVESAVLLVRDDQFSFYDSESAWSVGLAEVEWSLARTALGETQTLASVQSFSSAIAETFAQRAVVSVLLSFTLILVYIWVRFGSVRYSAAAVLCLLHDVTAMIGLVAVAEVLFESNIPAVTAVAEQLGIRPFRIDLNMIAAILTIIGYSLNDTIIVMDRVRENRGKLPYASRQIINDSINQTISRTVITSGTTLGAVLFLYILGGEGVRAFSYALLCGVLVGTYSSIAVAAPLVWSRKATGATASRKSSATV